MIACLGEQELLDFVTGRMDPSSFAAADQHVEICVSCQDQLEELITEPSLVLNGSTAVETWSAGLTADAAGTLLAGRYRLREVIGVGGMGTVWSADQTAPVRRAVAIKVIKGGMGGPGVLRRFEAERQALALMDHPNIARVLDGGETADGRPFFVMELVAGRPLTDYCDDARLDVRGRLSLFAEVCHAVQHAHQKGVIHRDLKPSNVLVATVDGKPVPKVIDFGVAKAVGDELTGESLATQTGMVVGTLDYMAPEQAAGAADIDTRCDVYSLGVMLYELLTGLRPLDAKRPGGLGELLRVIQEEEPPKPSTRVSGADTLASAAALRRTEPRRLVTLLRGDLDWVVLKCLEKPRDRRYESASALARDVERFLADEPVEARPPSAGYRLGKFLRRHKGPAVAVGLVAAALVLGIAGTTYGMIRATRERDAKELARQEEERQRRYAQGIAEFVRNDFLGLMSVEGQDRYGGHGKEELNRNTTLGQLLDRAAAKLRARNDLDPATEAELNLIVGINYRSAGEAKKGLEFLEKAVRLRTDQLGPNHRDTLNATTHLGATYSVAGLLDKAVARHAETLERQQAALGPDDRDTLASMTNLASAFNAAGKLELALPLHEKAFDLTKARLGPDDPQTLTCMAELAGAYQDAGKPDPAVRLLGEAFDRSKATRGPDHPDTLRAMGNLAQAYQEVGKLDRATPLFVEALRLTTAKHGPDHPATLSVAINLAGVYVAANKLDQAIAVFEDALKVATAKLESDHPMTLTVMNNLALTYDRADKLDKAVPLFEETLKRKRAKLGPDHPDTLVTLDSLAKAYWRSGQFDRAVTQFESSLKLKEAKHGRDHISTLLTIANLAVNYREAGRPADALPLFEEAYRAAKARRELAWIGPHLLGAYAKSGASAKFDGLLREQLLDARNTHPTASPELALRLGQMGGILVELGRCAEAEPLLREALAIHEATELKGAGTFYARSLVGAALFGQKKYADAEPLLRTGFEDMKADPAGRSAQGRAMLARIAARLVELYEATNRPDDAARWRKELAQRGKP